MQWENETSESDLEEAQVATPTATTSSITGGKAVTAACLTEFAQIWYTIDDGSFGEYSDRVLFTSVGSFSVTFVGKKSGLGDSEEYTLLVEVLPVGDPTFKVVDIAAGKSLELFCETPAVTILYSHALDGTPVSPSLPYSSAFAFTTAGVHSVKAVAQKSGMATSAVAFNDVTVLSVATPASEESLIAGGKSLELTSSTSDAEILFGFNSDLVTTIFSSALLFQSVAITTIHAMAKKIGMADSSTYSVDVSVSSVSTPFSSETSIAGGLALSLSCSTPDVKLFYSIDGASDTIYADPLEFTSAGSYSVSVVGKHIGMVDSSLYSTLVEVEAVLEPAVAGEKSVALVSNSVGAAIYYSLNGDAPSTLYSTALELPTGTTTVKAIAKKLGMADSTVLSQDVTVAQVATPTATTSSITGGKAVTAACLTEFARIWYKIDDGSFGECSDPVLFTSVGSFTVAFVGKKSGLGDSEEYIHPVEVTALPIATGLQANIANGKSLALSASVGAALLFSVDGDDPELLYSSALEFVGVEGTQSVRTVVRQDGFVDSDVGSFLVTVGRVPTPTASFVGILDGIKVLLTTTGTSALSYSLDSSTPSVPYNSGTGIVFIGECSTALKFRACENGLVCSREVEEEIRVLPVGDPTFKVVDIAAGKSLELFCETPAVTILYSHALDGTPLSPSLPYSSAFAFTTAGVHSVKAVAQKFGMATSAVTFIDVTVAQPLQLSRCRVRRAAAVEPALKPPLVALPPVVDAALFSKPKPKVEECRRRKSTTSRRQSPGPVGARGGTFKILSVRSRSMPLLLLEENSVAARQLNARLSRSNRLLQRNSRVKE